MRKLVEFYENPHHGEGDENRKTVVTGGNEREWMDEDGVTHVGVIPFMLDPAILTADR